MLASCARGRPAPGNRTRARPALWRFASIENGGWARGHGGQGRVRVRGRRRTASGMGVIGSCLYCASGCSGRASAAPAIKSRGGWAARPDEERSVLGAIAPPSLDLRGVYNAWASTAGKCPGPCAAATARTGRARGTAHCPPRKGSKRGRLGGGPLRGGLADPGRRVRCARRRMRTPVQEMRRSRVRRAQGALYARMLAGTGSRRTAARGCLPGAARPLATRCLAAGALGTRGPRAPQGGSAGAARTAYAPLLDGGRLERGRRRAAGAAAARRSASARAPRSASATAWGAARGRSWRRRTAAAAGKDGGGALG